jgi:hypothetical protein
MPSAAQLSPDELAQVEETFRRQLLNQVVPWRSRTVYLAAKRTVDKGKTVDE